MKIDGFVIDKYHRLVAEVYTKNGLNVNLEMVRNGFALPYYISKSHKNREKYYNYEKLAQQSKLNIWSDSEFVEPWKYSKYYSICVRVILFFQFKKEKIKKKKLKKQIIDKFYFNF